MYQESGQTPVGLYLCDIEKHKEHTVVNYETGKNICIFYNWDDDVFFYGTYSETRGRFFCLRTETRLRQENRPRVLHRHVSSCYV